MVVLNRIDTLVIASSESSDEKCSNYRYNSNLAQELFEFCKGCLEMASIPQGAFAACKIRSYSKDEMTLARIQNSDKQESKKFGNKEAMQYTPVKYNSKLMNSIWGLYNRYSTHNIKGNDDDSVPNQLTLQQFGSVAAYAITQKIVMGIGSGDEWNFPRKTNF